MATILDYKLQSIADNYDADKSQAEQNQANIDYISMMVDVELPDTEVNENE